MVVLDGWIGKNILSKFYEPKISLEEHENDTLQLKQKVHELLLKIQSNYQELKDATRENNAIEKDAKVSQLENKFILLKGKADAMMDKLRLITRKQNRMDDIVAINDDRYLHDKIDRVQTLSEIAREMSEILAHNPSVQDLRRSILDRLKSKINTMIQCVNHITEDDNHLTTIYERLSDL